MSKTAQHVRANKSCGLSHKTFRPLQSDGIPLVMLKYYSLNLNFTLLGTIKNENVQTSPPCILPGKPGFFILEELLCIIVLENLQYKIESLKLDVK